jgi:hypothetical protein
MQENIQPRRFFTHHYGGLPCIKTLKNFVGVVMFVKGLGIHLGVMKFPWLHR